MSLERKGKEFASTAKGKCRGDPEKRNTVVTRKRKKKTRGKRTNRVANRRAPQRRARKEEDPIRKDQFPPIMGARVLGRGGRKISRRGERKNKEIHYPGSLRKKEKSSDKNDGN